MDTDKLEISFEQKRESAAKEFGIAPEQMPRHIAIIMDGNGRWAQQKGLKRIEGHRKGSDVVEKMSLYCVALGIESLTLYSFSTENWKRPKREVNFLMFLYEKYLVHIRPILMNNNVRLVHIGRKKPLPKKVLTALADTIEITSKNTGMILAFALNYSSRTEIIDATRKIAQEYKDGQFALEDIDEECMNQHLYTAGTPDPDLLVRTSNEMRISNFLLWQISYSELHVTDTLWPDFGKSDVREAILEYASRNRRFGTLKK